MKKNLTRNTEMRILVIRLSAMGDVALTLPVLRAVRKQYPFAVITVLTKKAFAPFFITEDNAFRVVIPDLNGRHKGIVGLFRLFIDLRSEIKPDRVIDLHNVIRTRLLGLLFRACRIPVHIINKGRAEKRRLVKGVSRKTLDHTVTRYARVFREAGFNIDPVKEPSLDSIAIIPGWLLSSIDLPAPLIGVAPYAKHILKEWPEDYMIRLLNLIGERTRAVFCLFGGRDEIPRIEALSAKVKGSVSLAGKLSLEVELALMKRLDLMIAMDSSNMHMAALSGTKVISIWGATDPSAGFGAWSQPEEYSVLVPATELSCRPCTIYGKGTCRRGDIACLVHLTPEMVFNKMVDLKLI
ncbi:MAG: glycosyltransferase family 9 protein [Bacteroidales bacterium]